jgi:hypothetical protein
MIQVNQAQARNLIEESGDPNPGKPTRRRNDMKQTTAAVVATFAALALGTTALATMEIQKEYKAKDPAAKCATCHKENLPKKGAAELNDFGKTVKAAQGKDGKIDWSKVKVPEKK